VIIVGKFADVARPLVFEPACLEPDDDHRKGADQTRDDAGEAGVRDVFRELLAHLLEALLAGRQGVALGNSSDYLAFHDLVELLLNFW
jgi:hypothetical protein